MKSENKIEVTNVSSIFFPSHKVKGDLLIIGNFNGTCGDYSGEYGIESDNLNEASMNNSELVFNTLKKGKKLFIIGSQDTVNYFKAMIKSALEEGMFESKAEFEVRNRFGAPRNKKAIEKQFKTFVTDFENNDFFNLLKGMKFDTIILNPPYNGSLHLDFLEKCVELLENKTGEMVIIEPATWLINVRKNGKAKRYDEIKKKIAGHVKSVVIENLNKDFGTRLFMPFATTTIDMGKEYDTIDFVVCGEHKIVKSLYDCNLVGDYETIWSIFKKVQKFKNMVEKHTTKEDMGEGMWYCKYAEILGNNIIGCGAITERGGLHYDSECLWSKCLNGYFETGYFSSAWHYTANEISDKPLYSLDSGKHLTDKITDNIYGTKQELENWKHFIFNNKLPLFLDIVLTIDQNNNSMGFLPWLVNKQYTDEEINEMFGFTQEEINLIDRTLEKYERNSPWFKRYMCGPDAVSDEEVNKFIKTLNEKYA